MSVFKVIKSRRGSTQGSVEFGILPVSGDVVAGDEFCCHDTHHPVNFRVQAVQSTPDGVVLLCDGFYGFDDQFAGAIIDTAQNGRPLGFRYDAI